MAGGGLEHFLDSGSKHPTFHATFHPTFDAMFDDVQSWDGQTIQHFIEHLKAIEMLDEVLACFDPEKIPSNIAEHIFG